MTEIASDQKTNLIATTSEIAAAYVRRNHVAASDLPALIIRLHATLIRLAAGAPDEQGDSKPKITSALIRKSITPDALISFVDGKPYQTLKRHLGTHGMDPVSYRARYGLPFDYPMVAPSYSERRSALAKGNEFGRSSKGRSKRSA